VESFLSALSGGEGSHRALVQTWKIGAVAFTVFEAASSSAADYENAFQAAVDEGSKWQLALVQVPSDTQDAHGDLNPYLVTKAKFLARNVPVQEFRVETMRKPTNQRQWALGGIGLQVFAKLGGVPWLLKTNSKVHEHQADELDGLLDAQQRETADPFVRVEVLLVHRPTIYSVAPASSCSTATPRPPRPRSCAGSGPS
jgi:hypothetical protein